MNRESALLGTKTYSIFTGKKPFVDEYLEQKGLISYFKEEKDIKRIDLKKHSKDKIFMNKNLVNKITDLIINLN